MTAARNAALWLITAALACVVATLLGRTHTILQPGLHDAQLFRMIGNAWQHGWIPYRDLWDIKPPGIYALAAFISSTQLPWSITAAVVEAAAVLATAALVFALLRELGSERGMAALAAVATAGALNLSALHEGGFNTELFVALCSTAAMWLFLRAPSRGRHWFVAAGCSAGFGMLFKQVGAGVLLAQIAFVIGVAISRRTHSDDGSDSRANGHAQLSTVLLLMLGAALPWLLTILYFARHHAADDLMAAVFAVNVGNVGALQPGLLDSVKRFGRALLPIAPLALGAAALLCLLVFDRREQRAAQAARQHVLITLWVAADALGVMAGGRYYGHYLLALVPALATATALAVARLSGGSQRRRAVAAGLLLVPLFAGLARDTAPLLASSETQPRTDYATPIADAIREALPDGAATLLTWDYLPAVYTATGLLPPLRYAYVPAHGAAARRAAIADSVLQVLHLKPATFLVDAGATRGLPGRDTLRFAAYAALLQDRYRMIYADPQYGLRIHRLSSGR